MSTPCARNLQKKLLALGSVTVGDLIRDARHAKRLSQKDLARALDVTATTISRWETGFTPVPRRYINDLKRLLGVPPAAIEQALGVNLQAEAETELYVPLVQFLSRRSLGEQRALYDFLHSIERGSDQQRSPRPPRG